LLKTIFGEICFVLSVAALSTLIYGLALVPLLL
jgi:hypothetical protein